MSKTRSEPSTAPTSPAESDEEEEADVDYDDVCFFFPLSIPLMVSLQLPSISVYRYAFSYPPLNVKLQSLRGIL